MSHAHRISICLRLLFAQTFLPAPFAMSSELIKETRRKKNETQADNNCINGLWLKDQRLHGKRKRYHGQRSVAQDIRRNSEIYLFHCWVVWFGYSILSYFVFVNA